MEIGEIYYKTESKIPSQLFTFLSFLIELFCTQSLVTNFHIVQLHKQWHLFKVPMHKFELFNISIIDQIAIEKLLCKNWY